MTDSSNGRRRLPRPSRRQRFAFYGVGITICLFINIWAADRATQVHRMHVPYSPFFLQEVRAGNVEAITSKGTAIQGRLKQATKAPGASSAERNFSTEIPSFANTQQLDRLLQNGHVSVNAEPLQTSGAVVGAAAARRRADAAPAPAALLALPKADRRRADRLVRPLAAHPVPAELDENDVRRGGGHRRGESGADGDRRLPQKSGALQPARRPDPARGASQRPARNGQDAAGTRCGGRGRRPILLALGVGVRRGGDRYRRLARPRPLQAGEGRRAGDRLHRRARRDRAHPQLGGDSRWRRGAGADAQPDPYRDGRVHAVDEHHRDRRDEPSRDPRQGPAASRSVRPARRRAPARPRGQAADPRRAFPRHPARARRRPRRDRIDHSRDGGSRPREPRQRGGTGRRAARRRPGGARRLHRCAREDPARGRAEADADARTTAGARRITKRATRSPECSCQARILSGRSRSSRAVRRSA